MAQMSETDRMRIVREQVAAVEAGIKDGSIPELERVPRMRNAALVARHEPKVNAGEDALVAASRAQMRGDLREAHAIIAAAPASLSTTTDDVPSIPDGMGPSSVAPPAESSSAAGLAGPSGVSVDAGGHMWFEGLPASIAQDGTPRVVTSVGALTVATLRSLNLDMDEERLLHGSRVRMGVA